MGEAYAAFQVIAALYAIGSAIYTWFFQKGSDTLGPRMKDKDSQVSTYGIPIPIIYGTIRTAGNVIWAGPWIEVAITETVGKGGGGSSYTRYEYKRSFAVAFCEGEVDQLLKLWCDSKLVYNITGDNEKLAKQPGMAGGFKFYIGSETQMPDPTMEAQEGAGKVPAYRGIAYVVFNKLNLSRYGNRIPNVRALMGKATASSEDLYQIVGAYDYEYLNESNVSYCQDYTQECVMQLSNDETYLYTCSCYWDNEIYNDVYNWRLISTYSRKVITEKTYEPTLSIFADSDFTLDEQNYIYHGHFYSIFKLDGSTFATIAWSGFTVAVDKVVVSQNPSYPYLWGWVYSDSYQRKVALLNRDSLKNPFDSSEPAFFFDDPPSANYRVAAADINDTDGSLWVLRQHSSKATIYISHLLPTGTVENWDMSSELASMASMTCEDLLVYDSEQNQLIIGGYDYPTSSKLWFIDCDTMTLTSSSATLGPDYNEPCWQGFKNGIKDSKLVYIRSDGKIIEVDTTNRTTTEKSDLSVLVSYSYWGGAFSINRNSVYVGLTTLTINTQELFLGRYDASTVELKDIVSNICIRCSIATADINATTLTQSVYGYLVSDQITGVESIRPLSSAYMFDGVEVDSDLEFVRRGGPSVATIDETELSAHLDGEERPTPLKQVIKQEADLPVEVTLQYYDKDMNQDVNVQLAKRIITNTVNKQSVQLPVAMEKDRAKQLAEIMLGWAWTSRTSFEFNLGMKYLHLVPTDVITIEKTEATYQMMLTGISLEGNILKCQAVQDYESLYVSTASGTPGLIPDEEIDYAGPPIWYLLDVPPLQDSQGSDGGLYSVANGYTDYFTGADIYMYDAYTGNWSAFSSPSNRAVTGVVTTALARFDNNIFDESNTVTVRLDYEDHYLESCTETEIMQGHNYALLGDEIIQFQTITDNGSSSYTLSKLLRGRKGTEWATKNHVVGEKFILLSTTTVFWTSLNATYLEVETQFRGVSHGSDFSEGINKLYTPSFATLKPWSPVHISCATTGAGATVSWIRRNRIQNEWLNYQDVPMSEATESYSVDFYTGTTVSFTKSASTTSCTASAASISDIDSLLVYQISSVVGRGFASTTLSI